MVSKVLLQDNDKHVILPITRGELILDASGNQAFHSEDFVATEDRAGLLSASDKKKIDGMAAAKVENPLSIGVISEDNNEDVVCVYDGSSDVLFSIEAGDNVDIISGQNKITIESFINEYDLFVGNEDDHSNSNTENEDTYLKLFCNNALQRQFSVKGSGITEVSSDSDGNITIDTPISHNHTSKDIYDIDGYSKATKSGAIDTNDSLNTALGKLEYKADLGKSAYDWYISVTEPDADKYINKWSEIVEFLNSSKDNNNLLSDFVTVTTDQTISGAKIFSSQTEFNTESDESPFLVSSNTKVDNLNADLLDGFHANTTHKPFGTIPTIDSDGVMEIGKYLDFHRSNVQDNEYSTRLYCNGDANNEIQLPIENGTLALTSDIHNNTITINQNGEEKGSFNLNQSDDLSIDLNDTTYDVVSTSNNGLVPKLNSSTNDITSGYYVLTSTDGSETPDWYKIPIAGSNTLGLVKGFHRTSGYVSGTKTVNASNNPKINSRSTTDGRYYGVETDSEGYMFVNVPWERGEAGETITYTAGSGLSMGTNNTINHINAVTEQTEYPTGDSVSTAGGTITVRDVVYDGQGHITNHFDRVITLSQDHNKTSPDAGTAGTTSNTSGSTLEVPYIEVNADGHITDYGTRTHTITGFTNNKGTVTSIIPGIGLTRTNGSTEDDTAITSSGTINLKVASDDELGGIKLGYEESNKNYAVKLSKDGKAYVNVPWIQGSYSLPSATTNALGGIKVKAVSTSAVYTETNGSKYYGVNIDKDGKAYVALPSFKTTDKNTTYTFTGGTNKITINPSDGDSQDITITPSITDNITGTGTSGCLAKFDGTNSITDGPKFASVSSTKYLREDGTWQTPPNDGVTYTAGNNITISTANVISAKDTTYEVMTGASLFTAGTSGLVPAPAKNYHKRFLRGDGTWADIPNSGVTSFNDSTGDLTSSYQATTTNTTTGSYTIGTLSIAGETYTLYGKDTTTTYDALKNPHLLTIYDSGSKELVSYDGSTAKSITLKKDMIGLGNVDNTADANKTVAVANKLGTTTKGSTTKPIYLNKGTATECSLYAGGTAVTLNGTSNAAGTASFYAPTVVGTSGYVLKSNGSGAPSWVSQSDLSVGTASKLGTATEGSATKPIYLSSGSPTACTYSLNATVNSGTATRLAYYSANNAISAAGPYVSSNAIHASGGFYEDSDERLKTILNYVEVNLDDLSKLRKVYYLWKTYEDKSTKLGIIAQDVQSLFPEIVDADPDTGLLSVSYNKLSVIALAAIDKLYTEYKHLKGRIDRLEKLLSIKEDSCSFI